MISESRCHVPSDWDWSRAVSLQMELLWRKDTSLSGITHRTDWTLFSLCRLVPIHSPASPDSTSSFETHLNSSATHHHETISRHYIYIVPRSQNPENAREVLCVACGRRGGNLVPPLLVPYTSLVQENKTSFIS